MAILQPVPTPEALAKNRLPLKKGLRLDPDELARWLMAEHIALDPTGGASVEAVCPICGGPARYESAGQAQMELREFQTRRGKVEYRRAAARCPRCRKIFFPA